MFLFEAKPTCPDRRLLLTLEREVEATTREVYNMNHIDVKDERYLMKQSSNHQLRCIERGSDWNCQRNGDDSFGWLHGRRCASIRSTIVTEDTPTVLWVAHLGAGGFNRYAGDLAIQRERLKVALSKMGCRRRAVNRIVEARTPLHTQHRGSCVLQARDTLRDHGHTGPQHFDSSRLFGWGGSFETCPAVKIYKPWRI